MPKGGRRPGAGPKPTELARRRRHLEQLWYAEVSDDDHRAVIDQVKTKAKQGVQWAVVLYFERIQGKVPQPLEHAGDPERPLIVQHSSRGSSEDQYKA